MKRTLYIIGVMLCIWACAEQDDLQSTNTGKQTPIIIGSSYPGLTTRSVIDGGFSTGDEMGIFVVDRDEEGQAGEVLLQGNRASNMRFTLQENGSWSSPAQLYWSQKGLAADFYGYYPFDGDLSSVEAYPFVIVQRQDILDKGRGLNGYIASDLLWAKQENVSPTTETINLQYHHLMAGVRISLEKGTGFTAEEWNSFDKTVLLKNTILNGTVNLATGNVSIGEGNTSNIVPLPHQGRWRAVVFPQTVAAGKGLLSITIDGQDYTLTKNEAMNFLSGKMHSFTIQVDRTSPSGNFEFSLLDEAVTDWMDDADMHEGLVRQYIVVEVSEAGTLAATLETMGLNAAKLEALKVIGPVNSSDYQTISTMKKLTHLNLIKAIPEGGALYGINDIPLEKVFFPEQNLNSLDGFNGTHLTGSLIVPEGVVEVGGFWGAKFTGTLTLPSTLKVLGLDIDSFKGDLVIPAGLEKWEPIGFGNGGKITGTMYLPPTLKEINSQFPSGLTGTINIPQGCKICGEAFARTQCTSIVFPEGMTEIPVNCIGNSEIRGEIKLPSTVIKIGSCAFTGSKITKIIFPDALKEIEKGNYYFEGAFAGCRLMGTLTLPKNVARIPQGCFIDCVGITELVIPKGTQLLDAYCFARCSNIASIICEGEEPPFVADDAFLGVPKDNFTVEVPKGCVEKYRQARGWSDFKRIAEYKNFVCRPAQVGALNTIHTEEIVLNADGAWTVAEKPDWVTLSKTSGTGKTALTLTVQQQLKGQGNREGTVIFEMNGYTTSCVVRQYDYEHAEDSYLPLQTATKGNRGGIDIVFVGDGWDGESISNGSYLDLVEYQTECFFAIEPYRSMRDYFNVYVTFPLSQEKGVNTMYTYVNNRFGTLQGMSSIALGAITSSQLFIETDEVEQYVLDNTPVVQDNLWRTLVIAVPNSTEYEGNTVFNNSGLAISICPPSEQPYPRDTRGTIQHEAGGHGFAKLGDESISRNAFATTIIKQYIEEMHGRGWYANLATTGKLHDVPWAEFIFDPTYSDYVDVYEGGYGFTRGIYRPEANSCMNYGIPYYNTPSRLDIYKRIMDYAGESFSMEEFRAQDTFEWGPTTVTRSAAMDMENLIPYTSGNHHVPTIIRFREMGDKVRAIRNKLKNEKYK